MNSDEAGQMALEHQERQEIIERAVQKAYKGGLISKDEAWAIGYESGVPIKLEGQ